MTSADRSCWSRIVFVSKRDVCGYITYVPHACILFRLDTLFQTYWKFHRKSCPTSPYRTTRITTTTTIIIIVRRTIRWRARVNCTSDVGPRRRRRFVRPAARSTRRVAAHLTFSNANAHARRDVKRKPSEASCAHITRIAPVSHVLFVVSRADGGLKGRETYRRTFRPKSNISIVNSLGEKKKNSQIVVRFIRPPVFRTGEKPNDSIPHN